MARAISVKVRKEKVLEALKSRLTANASSLATNKAIDEQYQADLKKWNERILKDYASQLELDSINTRWNGQIEVTYKKINDFDIPNQPKRPDTENVLGSYEVQEIENAVRILEMSDEEYVNATTMKSIAGYL